MSDIQVTKAEMLRRIEDGRKAFDQMLSTWSEAQISRPAAPDGWSAKDHMAHLAAWEVGVAAALRGENRWSAMGLDGEPESEEAINAALYKRNKDRSLAQVRAAFDDAHQQIVKVISNMADGDLEKSYKYFQPNDPDEDDGRPIWPWIVGNSYGHYEEHTPWIKQVIENGDAGKS